MSENLEENKIRVNVDYRGPWELPFISKKVETFYFQTKPTVETLIKSLITKYGEDFKKISGFCYAIVDGKLIAPNKRASTELSDGEWVKFVFGMDGG